MLCLQSLLKPKEIITCKEGNCPPPLSAWYFNYFVVIRTEINRSVYLYTAGHFSQFSNNGTVIKINQTSEIEEVRANCCVFIFILFFLTFIVVAGIMYFTYRNYKKNIY